MNQKGYGGLVTGWTLGEFRDPQVSRDYAVLKQDSMSPRRQTLLKTIAHELSTIRKLRQEGLSQLVTNL